MHRKIETESQEYVHVRSPKVLLIVLLLGLAACNQPAVPEDHYYRLALPSAGGAKAQRLNGIVEVGRFVAKGLTAQRPIVFIEPGDNHQVQAYHYHFWTDPPTVMLQNALVNQLRAAGVAKSVVTPDLRVEADFAISGKISRFEQIIGQSGQVIVEIEFAIKEAGSDKLVFFKSYRETLATNNRTVPEAVSKISTAVANIYQNFLADIPSR
jgi:cholesterol transport system auxiliary component